MKVLVSGAHFTPAQAVIEELLKQNNVGIVYVGRKSTREGDRSPSVESQVLPKMGVKFIPIIAGRVRRYISVGTFISLFKIPIGFLQAFFILVKEQPDVVVSFGGYVAVPLVFNAWLLNIPVLIHEQTLVSGLANTFSSLFATKIAVSFNQEYPSFNKSKLVLTGNPMRKKILHPVKEGSKDVEAIIKFAEKEKKSLVLITGGNQGSHVLNEVVEKSLAKILEDFVVVHQTGDSKFKDYDRLTHWAHENKVDKKYLVCKWISEEDMGRLFRSVDLAVSRCGANTLLELSYHAVPTLMIPLPSVTKDEQTKNAEFFSQHGLGQVLLQKDLSPENLIEMMKKVVLDSEAKNRSQNVRDVVILGAEKKITAEILLISYRV